MIRSEILIATTALFMLWAGQAFALDVEGIETLMGRSQTLELAAQKTKHNLPVKIEKARGYFLVDQGANELVLSREFVANHGLWDYRFLHEVPGGDLVEYKNVIVGPWTLNGIRAVICDECTMLAGQSILNQFNLGSLERDGIEYLTLSR